ncbi:uncharacterized protein LOC117110781 [Anneissia japonica]|uniref:uncharacterized protein LOC117110781 n=1 Tax=Anneissia japonica TaxID=1529436 RepID=UPI0014257D54|nr:uncharacterized protein LOC117110781 [Anneissia japonica]XP_033109488.1 uncharacterized protein LOC117110781 [Anneissia japonica]
MKTTLKCDEADNTKWTEKEIDYKDEIKDKHENALAKKTAEDLQKQEVASSLEYRGEPIGDQKKKNSNDDTSGNEEAKQSKPNTNTTGERSQATTSASPMKDKIKIDANMREKIVQVLKGEPPRDNSLRIWDYGGQLIYHSIHRFYMTPKSIFVIVFNIADDLDDYAIVIDSSGNEHKYYMTNLEYLLYWIRSAYTYTRADVRGHCEKNFPVFIILGTHRNSPAKSGDDVNVEEKFEKILKALEDKVYESHVHPEIFAVENKLSSSDENFNKLKKVILEIKDEMKNPIPNTWLELLIEIQKLSEVALPLEQVKSMARECGILDDQTIDVAITYLSDVGEIMYHPTEEALKDIVVTQPMEIVEYFKTVFTIIEKKKRKKDLKKHWRKLEKGVLTKHLLKHLWEQFPIFQNDPNEEMFNFFVNLMTKFGLICPKKNENTDSDGIAYYAVSHLPPQRYVEDPKDDQVNDKVSIFHDFCGFLPDHLFHVAVTKFIEKFQVVNGFETELAYDQAKLSVDDHHYVRIAVATINHHRMFKTTIVRRQHPNAACVMELVPETCKKVLSFLESVLEGLCSSARGIKYQMCIPCSCSEKYQCMHNLENFNKDIVVCGDFQISIERYCRLFGDSSSTIYPSEQIAIQGMTDVQFNTLKMDVSTWYDDRKCLTMLKLLFRDHVDKVTLSGISNTMRLLNDLVTHDHLHSENLAILYDTIIITKHFGLQRKIKLPLFPDLKEGTILKEFTLHRQKLMKLGMNLTLNNVTQIDELLNTPCKEYTDVWSMIIDLEDRQIISEKNMKVFIDSLKILEIYPALNALQDLPPPPGATQPVVAPGSSLPQSPDAMTRSSDWIYKK